VSSEELLAAIRRHRLEVLLHGDPLVSELLPELAGPLKTFARSETMAAMALASLTREMAGLFEQAEIPMLVIKGVPLSLQTTGSLTARGRGDLDLLVDPRHVGEAIELLEREGFVLTNGASCVGAKGWRGRYSRFASIEISLHRKKGQRTEWIDLHWHAASVRGVLPAFSELLAYKQPILINTQIINTLSLNHAFLHACCHAAADRWMFLRNLADIHRLSFQINPSGLEKIGSSELVATAQAMLSMSGLPVSFQQWPSRPTQRSWKPDWTAIAKAAQTLDKWEQEPLLGFGIRNLALAWNAENWLSKMCLMVAPPDTLINPSSAEMLSLPEIFSYRFKKLRRQIAQRRLPALEKRPEATDRVEDDNE
jgi:hypothetical protein